MTAAITSCAEDYPDAERQLSFAGSDELAAQIRQGAPVDVYAAANTRLPDELEQEGLLDKPVESATDTFVLAVPKGSAIESVGDLAKPGVKIAIGSQSVPIGSSPARCWHGSRPTRRRRSSRTSAPTSPT